MKCFGRYSAIQTRIANVIVAIALLTQLCSVSSAQVQNTLYQQLVTASVVTGSVTLGPVRNIGQSFHQVLVTLQGGGCVPFNSDLSINIAGSAKNTYDSTAANFGIATNNLANNPTTTYQGVGAYPYVYVIVSVSTLASCNYSILYSGSVQPISPSNRTINILNAGGASSTAIATGTSTLVAGSAGSNATLLFYQFVAAADIATRLTLTCVATAAVFVLNVPTSGSVVVPYSGISYFACPSASNVNATVAAATTVFLDYAALEQRQ